MVSFTRAAGYRECPQCDTEQPFPLRRRVIEGHDDVIEVYIHCRVCPYEHVYRKSTIELENLYGMRRTLQMSMTNQMAKYGAVDSSQRAYEVNINDRIREIEDELRDD